MDKIKTIVKLIAEFTKILGRISNFHIFVKYNRNSNFFN
ncbi:hypothetical protein BA6E_101159 [Bacteroidales bacterium 6E]|nr:hypothetical protein BA6E_101159 [Bacteroidales bacterium 6E]